MGQFKPLKLILNNNIILYCFGRRLVVKRARKFRAVRWKKNLVCCKKKKKKKTTIYYNII